MAKPRKTARATSGCPLFRLPALVVTCAGDVPVLVAVADAPRLKLVAVGLLVATAAAPEEPTSIVTTDAVLLRPGPAATMPPPAGAEGCDAAAADAWTLPGEMVRVDPTA